MENSTQLSQHLALLHTRRATLNRDSVIAGVAFIVTLSATLTAGLLLGLSGRLVYLIAALNIFFAVNYLRVWVRLEILKESIALLESLQRSRG